jgi:hypothetical protein
MRSRHDFHQSGSRGESLAIAFGVARAFVVLDPMLPVVGVAPGVAAARSGGSAAPTLVARFERGEGKESGFMHDDGAQPVENFDCRWNCGAIFT